MTVRAATFADVPWLLSVARRQYGERYDWLGLERYTYATLASGTTLILRNDTHFLFLLITRMPWEVRERAFLMFFAGLPSERPGRGLGWNPATREILTTAISIARSRGCPAMEAGAESGYDLAPLLRRLGGEPYTLYRLRL